MNGAIGLYVPGTSLLHRCPTGPKLLCLMVALVLTMWYPAFAVIPTMLLYVVARIPVRAALAQIRPLWMLLLITFAFQIITEGLRKASEITGGIILAVALASIVTLTTQVTAMLDAMATAAKPLRHIGIDPERVALLLALTIRCIPILAGIMSSVREAQLVRGAGRNPIALAVPIVIRTLRTADALGEALTARGVDD